MMAQQMPNPGMMNPQFAHHQAYLMKSVPLIPAVTPNNPNYKH